MAQSPWNLGFALQPWMADDLVYGTEVYKHNTELEIKPAYALEN